MEFFVLPFFLSFCSSTWFKTIFACNFFSCNCCRRMSLLLLHFRCCKCVEWNVMLIQNMILSTYGYSRIYTCCSTGTGYVVSLIQSLTGYSSFLVQLLLAYLFLCEILTVFLSTIPLSSILFCALLFYVRALSLSTARRT